MRLVTARLPLLVGVLLVLVPGVVGVTPGRWTPGAGPAAAQPPTPPIGTCSATYRTVGSWPGGFQGEVTVTAGVVGAGGWRVSWPLASGQAVIGVWGGTATVSGGVVTVRNADWNGALAPGATTRFGLTGTGPDTAPPTVSCAL